jgi:ATP-dependent Clp protease ATP-binding subunit ClpB
VNTAATGPDAPFVQTWLREVDNSLVIAPHVVIVGNVLDYQLVSGELVGSVPEALWRVLALASYEFLLVFDPLNGVSVLPEDAYAAAAEFLGVPVGEEGERLSATLEECLRATQEGPRKRVALAVEQASRLLGDARSPNPGAFQYFQLAEWLAATTLPTALGGSSLYNVCFWIAQSERDLPDWFASNPRVRLVTLPMPTPTDRRRLIVELTQAESESCSGLSPQQKSHFEPDGGWKAGLSLQLIEQVNEAVDATAGLQLRTLSEINQLAQRHGTGLEGLPAAARAYRVGIADSPWDQEETRARVRKAASALAQRVLGQDAAIRLSLDILTRGVTGLSGAQTTGSGQRPRGVLFYAGPTGVGKTELAKALTKVIFGQEDRYVRFDMSEFTAEQAEARLIGAPPGYIGHNAGGELTNAMRRQPFSLVLFDEIEKAHPRILDKFLQIIDDGRLTDGAGATVFFSEAILVFTSNKGMNESLPGGGVISANTPPEIMEATVLKGIGRYFRAPGPEGLGRPELLNRFGDNIVVFRYITPEVAIGIFDLCLARITARVKEAQGVALVLSDIARESLRAFATADLSMGGRGILNCLEAALVNPLARHLFEMPPVRGQAVRVEAARKTPAGWELDVL